MEEMVRQVLKARMFQQGRLMQKLCVTEELNMTTTIQMNDIAQAFATLLLQARTNLKCLWRRWGKRRQRRRSWPADNPWLFWSVCNQHWTHVIWWTWGNWRGWRGRIRCK